MWGSSWNCETSPHLAATDLDRDQRRWPASQHGWLAPSRGNLFRLELAGEDAHNHAVKLGAAQGLQFGYGGFGSAGGGEGTLRGHVDVGVGHVQDARAQRNFLPAQARGIAAAVKVLVMVLHPLPQPPAARN